MNCEINNKGRGIQKIVKGNEIRNLLRVNLGVVFIIDKKIKWIDRRSSRRRWPRILSVFIISSRRLGMVLLQLLLFLQNLFEQPSGHFMVSSFGVCVSEIWIPNPFLCCNIWSSALHGLLLQCNCKCDKHLSILEAVQFRTRLLMERMQAHRRTPNIGSAQLGQLDQPTKTLPLICQVSNQLGQ